jgi:hypothetical protein
MVLGFQFASEKVHIIKSVTLFSRSYEYTLSIVRTILFFFL